jgi:hypothetical protein
LCQSFHERRGSKVSGEGLLQAMAKMVGSVLAVHHPLPTTPQSVLSEVEVAQRSPETFTLALPGF